jgi:DNA invertase Pin-like site-specific DNA recombinase
MGKQSRLKDRDRRRLALERQTARSDQPHQRAVTVPAGYPDIGWREEVGRLEREVIGHRRRQLDLVAQALLAGCTYSEVARVLGCSRQAAYKRFRHLKLSAETQG